MRTIAFRTLDMDMVVASSVGVTSSVGELEVHRLVEVEEPPLALLLGSIGDTRLSPCKSSSRRDRSIFHIGCKHRLLVGSGGRSIGLELEL